MAAESDRLAAEEEALSETLFLAPRVAGGTVRARVGGLAVDASDHVFLSGTSAGFTRDGRRRIG